MDSALLTPCRECGHLMEADGSHRCPDVDYLKAREALMGNAIPAHEAPLATTTLRGCSRRYRVYIAALRGERASYEGFVRWVAEQWERFHAVAEMEAPPLPFSSRKVLTLSQDDIHKGFDDWLALKYGEAPADHPDPITL